MEQINCKHYDGDGFSYALDNNTELCLCEHCNMNLAGEIMKQLALHVFLPEKKEE